MKMTRTRPNTMALVAEILDTPEGIDPERIQQHNIDALLWMAEASMVTAHEPCALKHCTHGGAGQRDTFLDYITDWVATPAFLDALVR